MSAQSPFLDAVALPGWFGKLPGMGDFAHRRLSETFRDRLDRWLQEGLRRLRTEHEDWARHYLDGPLWFFALAEGVADERAWVGVLMPSVDGVGRYFPLLLAAECDGSLHELGAAEAARVRRWWALAAEAALKGLECDLDANRFDAALQQLFSAQQDAQESDLESEPVEASLEGPAAGQSLWLTDPAGAQNLLMTVCGLPTEARFDALFGFAGGQWLHKEVAA